MKLEIGKEYRLRNGYTAVMAEKVPVAHMEIKQYLGRFKPNGSDEYWRSGMWYANGISRFLGQEYDIICENGGVPCQDHIGKRFRFDMDACGESRHHLIGKTGLVVGPTGGCIDWYDGKRLFGFIMETDNEPAGQIYRFSDTDRIILEDES